MTRRTRLLACALIGAAGLAVAAPTLAAAAEPAHYRAYVDSRWGQLHVRVHGDPSQPTMIMLHKMVWSSMEFVKVQPNLARHGVRSIAVDLPGYGLSDAPDAEPSAEDYARALLPVLDRFDLKRATIMGSDTGAAIATAFANLYPDRIDRLVLEGPPMFDAPTRAKLMEETEFDRTPTNDGSEFVRRISGIHASLPAGALTNEDLQVGALQFFQAAPNYLYGHHAAFRYDMEAGLKAVKVPTMVISFPGKASVGLLPAVKSLRPDFTYVGLDFKGMMAVRDEPEPWAAAVAGFVTGKR